jgi:hypothetical protein
MIVFFKVESIYNQEILVALLFFNGFQKSNENIITVIIKAQLNTKNGDLHFILKQFRLRLSQSSGILLLIP